MRFFSRIALVLALFLSACGSGVGEDIHIGLAAPVSISFGEGFVNGAMLAIDEINAEQAMRGRRLVLEIKDDEMERERAIEVAAEFRDEGKVVAVIGHSTSGSTIAAADIYNHPENGLLEISPTATSPELSGKGEWTFRVCPTDLHQGRALADWAYGRLDLRRAAVIYANDEYGRGVLNAFVPAFEQLGGAIIAQDPFLHSLLEEPTTYDPFIERAQAAGMDALIVVGVGDEVIDIIRAARRLGYTGAVMGGDGLTDLLGQGEVVEGVYLTSAFLPDRPAELSRDFVQRYTERFGELPSDRAALTYDAVRLIAHAIDEVGPDRRALREYIAAVGSTRPEFEGVTGTIGFDQNGDVVGKEMSVGVIREGQVITAR